MYTKNIYKEYSYFQKKKNSFPTNATFQMDDISHGRFIWIKIDILFKLYQKKSSYSVYEL